MHVYFKGSSWNYIELPSQALMITIYISRAFYILLDIWIDSDGRFIYELNLNSQPYITVFIYSENYSHLEILIRISINIYHNGDRLSSVIKILKCFQILIRSWFLWKIFSNCIIYCWTFITQFREGSKNLAVSYKFY